MPGSASYSQRIAMVGPSPVSMVPRNAVSMPATPRSTSKPCVSRNSASHAAALTSWNASSGWSWIWRESFSRSSARRSTAGPMRSLTALMASLPEVGSVARSDREPLYTGAASGECRRWGDWTARCDRRSSPWSPGWAATFGHRSSRSSPGWAATTCRRWSPSSSAAAGAARWRSPPARGPRPFLDTVSVRCEKIFPIRATFLCRLATGALSFRRMSADSRSAALPLRRHLVLLVVAAVVPVVVFTTIVLAVFARGERASTERGLRDTTRALTLAVDREIETSIKALQVLAASLHLDADDYAAFERHSARVLPTQPWWRMVVLADAHGDVVQTSARGGGVVTHASLAGRPYFREMQRTLRPALSAVLLDRATAAPTLAIVVPVVRDGRLRGGLGADLEPAALSQFVAAQNLPSDWTGTIIDRDGFVLARSRAPETWIGRPAGTLLGALAGDAGWTRGVDADGVIAYAAHSRSATTCSTRAGAAWTPTPPPRSSSASRAIGYSAARCTSAPCPATWRRHGASCAPRARWSAASACCGPTAPGATSSSPRRPTCCRDATWRSCATSPHAARRRTTCDGASARRPPSPTSRGGSTSGSTSTRS